MSDVERICMMNHERRRWAEEYDARQADRESRKAADRERKLHLRGATLISAVFVGIGLTLLGMGIEAMQPQTILIGLLSTIIFGVFGCVLEELTYEPLTETVYCKFETGAARRVNVAMDSGTAMIKDVMSVLG